MPSGCMVCGADLSYPEAPIDVRCEYCGLTQRSQALCVEGHHVCDSCHASDALLVIRHLCETSDSKDMIAMMKQVRAHPAIHVHGPEHHAMVPAVMVATYRNLGGQIPEGALQTAIDRGAKVPGGFCGLAGSCGAALGVGIGFAVILGSNPLRPALRQKSIGTTAAAMTKIAEREAARCCQRDCWLALRSAAESSRELLPISLRAEDEISCGQVAANKECLLKGCPIFPARGARTP